MHNESEAALANQPFEPIIEVPYRWRNYTDGLHSLTVDELLAFITNDESVRHGGTRSTESFAYLRGLEDNGQCKVLACVFQGVQHRFESGYLLRDVIDKVDGIHFSSTEAVDTLGHLYESRLREMVKKLP